MDKKKRIKEKTSLVIDAYHNKDKTIPNDVFGSYTGNDINNETPIQDNDDI